MFNYNSLNCVKSFSIIWIFFYVKPVILEDVCAVVSYTDFQLQLRGPLLSKSKHIVQFINFKNCSNLCCKANTCDVALFVNQTCILVDCPSVSSPSCQPFISHSNSIDPFVLERNSSLSYVQKRHSSQDNLVSSSIFHELLTSSLLPTTSYLNVHSPPEESSHGSLNKLDEEEVGTTKTATQTSAMYLEEQSSSIKNVGSSTTSHFTENVSVTDSSNETTASPTLSTIASTTSSASTYFLHNLKVKISGKTQIRLPNDSVVLHAKVEKKPSSHAYDFKWILIGHPNDFQGEENVRGNSLSLESLKAGVYQYKVEVTSSGAFGEAYVNITVNKLFRVNKAPVAVITPNHQEITLPNDNAVLDGSSSHDDDKIVKYQWKVVGKPLETPEKLWTDNNQKMLVLKGLVAGEYEFQLTVTDSDGVRNSSTATVVVNKKIDHKPIANAGLNQVIHLPQNSVTLYANNSVDDHGIVSYKWALSPDSPNDVVDLQGARTSELHLSNFESGRYKIRLTVTDASDQEDTATVTVTVLPESNHPPVANAGDDKQVYIQLDGNDTPIRLDGSKSTDDKGIKTVAWRQKSGPTESKIVNPNSITTPVTGIKIAGNYVFELTVSDKEGKSSSDEVTIIVSEIKAPVPDAGPDQMFQLPDDVIVLDGSKSRDDYGIKSFHWTRDTSSLATGRIVNGSDDTSRLVVSGVTEGKYQFTLTVTNIHGKFASDQVSVVVKGDPRIRNLVELHLAISSVAFTESMKNMVAKQIPLLLSLVENQKVVIESVYPEHRTGHLVVLFYVERLDGNCMSAIDVVTTLNDKLQSDVHLFDVNVVLVDTYVCENNCSGHGTCHSGSKLCQCDMFWMQNFFRVLMGDGMSNCDWSVLYVVIFTFVIVVSALAIAVFIFRLCKRKQKNKNSRVKRRKKSYIPIENEAEKVPLKSTKNGVVKNGFRKPSNFRTSSLMHSLTSSSDENNTLFEKQRLIKNGRKNRPKKRETPNTLIDFNDRPESEPEFDGTGLDNVPATLHSMRSSDEFV